jgi:hypothetical protein
LADLQRLFEEEWADEGRLHGWPRALVCKLLAELLLVGVAADWVRTWLVSIEPTTFRGEDLEDALADAVEHARAWIIAGEIVRARATFQRALRAAFGNEAKDDQLKACLVWAVRANRQDPAAAPERLAQMAAAVLSLDGAEAERYVAPDLVRAAVDAGARPARVLVEWALRNDVRGWTEALAIFIDGLARRATDASGVLSACYRALVLPFARAADIDPMAQLGKALRTAQEYQELDALAEAIEVIALGSTRPALREALAGRSDAAAELLRDNAVTDRTAPGQIIDAFEGLSLTLRELQERVRRIEDVEDLVRRLKPNAYSYRWELILGPFISRAADDELVAIAAAIPENGYAWNVLVTIAGRLIDLGDGRVGAILERAIRNSRAGGWSERYDGGSRLASYELLVSRSPQEGRRRAWEALRNDYAAGEVGAINLFAAWNRIVAMLAPDVSPTETWEQVSRHVAALVAHAPLGEPLALPPAEDPHDSVAAANAVSRFVAAYLDHPALALAQGAQQFFTDRLLAGDAIAESVLAARLADPDSPKNGPLLVLSAVNQVRGGVPASMRQALRALARASDYLDRRVALAVIGPSDSSELEDSSGMSASTRTPRIIRPLPVVFSLVHPAALPARQRPLPRRGEMLPTAEDAADLVSTVRAELDLIAEWAGVQPEALYNYVAERANARLQQGGQDDEPAVRDELRRLGLEITYRRPRPRRVERAMAEAAATLVDCGRLDERHFAALDRIFRNADPHFLVARPTRRPPTIAAIPERANSQYVGRDWTQGVTPHNAVVGRTIHRTSSAESNARLTACQNSDDDGWVVLAEETWLRWLDWKLATETRVGCRLEPRLRARRNRRRRVRETGDGEDIDGDAVAGQALNAHVAELSHLMVSEYLQRARAPYSAVVRNMTYRFETPADSWLAFNPALAELIGWLPAMDGLFRWVDTDGNVAAESIWWQDGSTHQRPPLFEEEVGCGWLVRVSVRSWHQLATVMGTCVDWRRVARLAQEQDPREIEGYEPVPETQARE